MSTSSNRAAIAVVLLCSGAGMLLTFGTPRVAAQPEGDESPAAMQAAVDRWIQSTKPGAHHSALERFVGEWETTTRLFMGPGAPAIQTEGTARGELILGGRFVKTEFSGSFKMPEPDGTMKTVPHNGLGLIGFDNNRKLYSMMWVESLNTAIQSAAGALNQDQSLLTLIGQMDEPMTGEMGKAVKYCYRFSGPDKWTLEVFEVLYGDEFKVVEVEHRRRK